MDDIFGAVNRAVRLRVPHDNQTGDGLSDVDLVARSGPSEGEIMLDDAGRRSFVRALGDPVRVELTMRLLPGWLPDSWWDIDPSNSTALQAALARVNTDEWDARYLSGSIAEATMHHGRLWVLNESGEYSYTLHADGSIDASYPFKRTAGPYSAAATWLPYDFSQLVSGSGGGNVPGIPELAVRTRRGFACRRRRFLPPLAEHPDSGAPVPMCVWLSASGDAGPWYYADWVELHALEDQCAIIIRDRDLRQITLGEETFVTAYIKGLLRVRITAVVELDDQVVGDARLAENQMVLPWATVLDRRGQLHAELRSVPANTLWNTWGFTTPADNTGDFARARMMARRVLDESGLRRAPGLVSIPYLLQPSRSAPWDNYQVGDEVYSIETDLAGTRIDLAQQVGADGAQRSAPVLCGVTYRYRSANPPDMATMLQIEDATYSEDDDPGEMKEPSRA